jgi:hypothetical protein
MNRSRIISPLLLLATSLAAGGGVVSGQRSPEGPRVFLLDIKAKDRLTKSLDPAVKKIDEDARKALMSKVAPIVSKEAAPPTGDKHDYMSQAPYF